MIGAETQILKKAWHMLIENGVSSLDLFLYDRLASSPDTEFLEDEEIFKLILKIKDKYNTFYEDGRSLEECIETVIYNY
jgi:hypothetical protein